MPFNSRPFFFFPALAIGVALAIVFFKVYGQATQPDVPTPVANTLHYFAPGVELNKPVKDAKGIGELTWVRHVGFVSNLPRGGFVQTRLLVSHEEAEKEVGDRNAIVEAVEIVSNTNEMQGLMTEAQMSIRKQPRYGCVFSGGTLGNRAVMFYLTPKDLGGFAFIDGLSKTDTLAEREETRARMARMKAAAESGYYRTEYAKSPPVFKVWSMIVWNGKFDGARTLRAKFEERPCSMVGVKEFPAGYDQTFAATDSMTESFDVVGAKQRALLAEADLRQKMDSAGRFADACFGTNLVHTDGWTRREFAALPVSVLMPPEYSRRRAASSDGPDSLAQTYVAPDGSTIWFARAASRVDLSATPDLGMETECEATISGVAAHLETGRRLPAMVTKTTSAAYQLPTGAWLVVMASAPTAERQQQQLRMIREVQFARQWGKPPANVPHIAIDSL